VVEGVDRSPDLIETARRSVRGHGNAVSFRVGDLLALPEAQYDSILCRGVLNDFVDEDARLSVFEAFARERTSDYRFVMRCWTGRELESAFVRNGFGAVAYFGAYDPAVHAGATDRLVAVAQSSDRSRG
jgi:hypothetical protein